MANNKTSENKKSTKTTTSAKKTNNAKTTTSKKTTKTVAATKKVESKKETKTLENKKTEVKPVETKKETIKKETKKTFNFTDWVKENYMIVGLIFVALLLIINIIIVTNGHKVKLSDGKEVIASIDGKDFTAEDLFDDLKEKYGSDSLLTLVDSYIVEQELSNDEKVSAKESAQESIDSIREQYETYGYDWETVLTQYGYSGEEELLQEFILSSEKEVAAKNYIKNNLTDDEITEYYANNVYGTYSAKHILIIPDTNDDMSDEEISAAEEAAKNKAQEVINRLNNGEDFDSLVKEYSEDEGSVDNNGLIENFTKGDVVDEFWDAVESLNDNEYTTEPVKSSYGYHIIYRVSSTEKQTLNEIKDSLVDEIVESKLNDDSSLYTNTWIAIRKKYNFTINDTVIKESYENTVTE
jgi:foldase protein PrsA